MFSFDSNVVFQNGILVEFSSETLNHLCVDKGRFFGFAFLVCKPIWIESSVLIGDCDKPAAVITRIINLSSDPVKLANFFCSFWNLLVDLRLFVSGELGGRSELQMALRHGT